MRQAVIEIATGKVAYVIDIQPGSTWKLPANHIVRDADNAEEGGSWDGVKFVPRPLTLEEVANQVRVQKRREARERAIAAIKANKGGAPWGRILYDLAVAQGLIEEA